MDAKLVGRPGSHPCEHPTQSAYENDPRKGEADLARPRHE
jgi:hypothetical protein